MQEGNGGINWNFADLSGNNHLILGSVEILFQNAGNVGFYFPNPLAGW